jgi:hypothetical protein
MAVVDGAVHIVASNREALNRALEAARPNAASRAARLAVVEVVEMANSLTAKIVLERASSSHAGAAAAVLLVAVVEDGLKVKVARGENRGRTLHHDRCVRAFVELPVAAGGTAAAKTVVEAFVPSLPADVDRDRAELVVLLQDAATMQLLGSVQQRLRVATSVSTLV